MLLSNNTQIELVGTLTPGAPGVAGTRAKANLTKGQRTLAIHVEVEADATIGTADATAIVDTGSVLNIFTECGVNDGADRLPSNPQDMRALSEFLYPGMETPVRLASTSHVTNGGVTHLKECFTIPCSNPYAANPEEMALMEHRPDGDYVFYVNQVNAADGGGSLVATAGGGGGTVTITNVVVRVYQEYVASGGTLPVFQPFFELDSIPVSGTDGGLNKVFNKQNYIIGMLLREQVTGNLRVSDVLQAFSLSGTGRDYVGPTLMTKSDFQLLTKRSLPNASFTVGGVNPYTFWLFQRRGLLSKVIRPGDPNFKARLSVQLSATSGGASSAIKILYLEGVRDNTVRSNGTRVTLTDADLAKRGIVL